MEYDKINLGAYNLHFIKTERFKTTTISVNFREKIEKEMTYPGQIKVSVIRETRAIEIAK